VGYISRQLGVSPDTLQEYNYALSSKVWSGAQKIPAGYLLKVPAAMGADLANLSQPEPECFEPTHTGSSTVYGGGSYLVRKGDSLGKIASRHEVTVAALRGANGLRSDVVRLGQKLIIPSAGRSAPSPASVNRVSNAVSEKPHARSIASSGVYIVKRGDTLSSIAAKSRISISQLKAANNLRGSTVMVGQRLNLAPSKGYIASRSQKATQGMKVYKVRSGETLWHIASKFGVRVDDLKRSNNLSSNSIKVGQQLRIPS
jgi:N-acetylmuramoyl-L-alanine amidase